jgi:hypothetical protein
MAEQKVEDDWTNEEKLAFVGIPLAAQVLSTETQELDNDVDRRKPINDTFNRELTDYKGNTLYVTAEEMAEIELALTMGDLYVQKIWLYGHYLKAALDADFDKYGLPESLNYPLKNQTTTTFPRHMPLGNYSIKDPRFGCITIEELQQIRKIDTENSKIGGSLSMSALGGSQTASGVMNNVVIHATAGQPVVQLEQLNSATLEQAYSYFVSVPADSTPATLNVIFNKVRTRVDTVLQLADKSLVPELLTQHPSYKNSRWLEWTFDQLYPILKKCLNLMTTATDVNSIKTALDKQVLTSTPANWHNPMTFVNYKDQVYNELKENSVMSRTTDEMNSVLSANEQKLVANSLFDNLPTSNAMEKAFKNVVKATSAESKGKFNTISDFFDNSSEVFSERLRVAANARKFAIPLSGLSTDMNHNGGNRKRPGGGGLGGGGVGDEDDTSLNNINEVVDGSKRCDGCGYIGLCVNKRSCVYSKHPGFNQEQKSWADSTSGKAYNSATFSRNQTNAGCKHLIFEYKPDGTKLSEDEVNELKQRGCSKIKIDYNNKSPSKQPRKK